MSKAFRPMIKICGLTSVAAVEAAADAGADYVGFVFFPSSPRFVTAEAAAVLSTRAGVARLVGLFVNPVWEEIQSVLSIVALDVLQIYAPEAVIARLRRRTPTTIWQSIGVGSEMDLPKSDNSAQGYVLEAKPPRGATRPGGNAVLADWTLFKHFDPSPKPWLLAGGLTPGNVAEAIRATSAPGVDVSSGVEAAIGVKSPDLIRAFIAAAQSGASG